MPSPHVENGSGVGFGVGFGVLRTRGILILLLGVTEGDGEIDGDTKLTDTVGGGTCFRSRFMPKRLATKMSIEATNLAIKSIYSK